MMNDMTPSPDESRDLAAEDAHTALRSALMPLIQRHPGAQVIGQKIVTGAAELQVDYHPGYRMFAASLVASDIKNFLSASLQDDAAAADLKDILGIALVAALNHEAPERRQALDDAVRAGAEYVCRLRVLGHIESFTMALALGNTVVWQATRAKTFPDETGPTTLH